MLETRMSTMKATLSLPKRLQGWVAIYYSHQWLSMNGSVSINTNLPNIKNQLHILYKNCFINWLFNVSWTQFKYITEPSDEPELIQHNRMTSLNIACLLRRFTNTCYLLYFQNKEGQFFVPFDSELECRQNVVVYDSNTDSPNALSKLWVNYFTDFLRLSFWVKSKF